VAGRACIHKIAIGDSGLSNVRFGPLCELKSDISRGPRSATTGHKALPESGVGDLGRRLVGALRFCGRRCEIMLGARQAVRCRGSFHQGGLNSGTFDTRWYQKEEG
jgi:hypothetical protein